MKIEKPGVGRPLLGPANTDGHSNNLLIQQSWTDGCPEKRNKSSESLGHKTLELKRKRHNFCKVLIIYKIKDRIYKGSLANNGCCTILRIGGGVGLIQTFSGPGGFRCLLS